MLRVLEAQAPPKQTATDTINTLSTRLANATLLEDRRGAIQGLRSFAKEYPASVASGALRQLISTLRKDVDDVDTGKVILETLLMLFSPNEDSPEASDDIALWLADTFSQRQDNITVLLDLLDSSDFYSRLYALQLLSAISSARPERTQECILSAPLGTTRLVATLDDSREAVRSAGLLLLNDVTQDSIEIQKVVAFENAFDRIFNIIKAEGSLAEGGIVVQDCLSLLANLLRLNASNQSLFRETGFVTKLAQLLSEDARKSSGEDDLREADGTKEKNIWGLLAVLRLFLVQGNLGTQANQNALEKHGVLKLVLELSFSNDIGPSIQAEALKTCADIIQGNSQIQERFALNTVPRNTRPQANGESTKTANANLKTYIIDALLDTTLSVASVSLFDVRLAASQCIQAYFYNHLPIRHHFLKRAIDGHTSGDDETSNILSILIFGPQSYESSDPYRLWFAADLVLQLLFGSTESKNMAMAIAEGDAASGEEVVTCIQAMAANLIRALQSGEDDRICVGYLMVLCGWLFEDADAVNDLLSEGSVVQSLIQAASRNEKGREIVQGMCAVLLGIIYEFSTKDSPIPRRTLQPLLTSGIGREHYVSKITRLRENAFIRDFEVLPQSLASAELGSYPDVYFNQTFVNFLKDNFTRFIRAIDKDPGLEISLSHVGIDRDLVDSLQSQIKDKNEAIEKAETDMLNLQGKLGQEQADHRRSQETFNAELTRIKNINEALQRGHEAEIDKSETEHRTAIQEIQEQHRRRAVDLEKQIHDARSDASRQAETVDGRHRSEIVALQAHIKDLEQTVGQSNETIETLQRTNNTVSETVKQRDGQISSIKKDKEMLEETIALNIVNARNLENQVKDLENRLKESRKHETELQVELNAKEETRQAVQTELDDLLIVLGDLEEKRSQDKVKLKELGVDVSDAEDEDEGEDEAEEEQDEDEDEEEQDGANGAATANRKGVQQTDGHERDSSVD